MKSKVEFYKAFFEELEKKGFGVDKPSSPDYVVDILFKGKTVAFYTKNDMIEKNPFEDIPEKQMERLWSIAKATVSLCGICNDKPYDDQKTEKLNNNRPIQRQYFYNKEEAFESFAVRSGLVDEKKLFTESELKILYDGLIKVSTQDESLSQDQLEEVGKLVNRMEELLPELHKEEKRFDMSKLLDAISFGNMGNGMER